MLKGNLNKGTSLKVPDPVLKLPVYFDLKKLSSSLFACSSINRTLFFFLNVHHLNDEISGGRLQQIRRLVRLEPPRGRFNGGRKFIRWDIAQVPTLLRCWTLGVFLCQFGKILPTL